LFALGRKTTVDLLFSTMPNRQPIDAARSAIQPRPGRHRSPRRAAYGAALLLLPAASALCTISITLAAERSSTTDRRWRQAVESRGVDPDSIDNPLRFTREMQDVARGVAGRGPDLQRLRNLQLFLFNEDDFPFDYESRTSYTAEEAFERRTGNCVSFTNLFISLARSIEVPVNAAVLTRPGSVEKEGDLIVVNNHLIAVYEHTSGVAAFDFNRQRREERVGLRLLDDLWITSIYLNNRGAERLLEGDTQAASHFLETAVKLAPDFVPAYGNLGIVRRQTGDIEGAFEAYRIALEHQPGQASILNNLAVLYQAQGQQLEAEAALRAADLSGATPYVMIIRGNFERGDGRPKAAMRLYKVAAKISPEIPEPWLAIAGLQIERGRPIPAEKALRRALEIDPDNEYARQMLRSLDQPQQDGP
jgi:Tfp pilus assembly protein PilF